MNAPASFPHPYPLRHGQVSLVGAGPGDPDLLTLKALRRLSEADVVLYDLLVSDAVLALVNRRAEQICVGKRASRHTLPQQDINQLIVAKAQQGLRVVRLKGGDPFLFGRGGEELETLAAAGIACEVIPGISAAMGAAAAAGIPLTHRDYAQGVSFVTGHRREGQSVLEWTGHTGAEETLVVYMGLGEAANIADQLQAAGRAAATPVAIIENATTAQQRVLCCELASLGACVQQHAVKPPALLIIGEVVRLQARLQATLAQALAG